MPMTLAEYEAICEGRIQGKVTPADTMRLMSYVSALGDKYIRRIESEKEGWGIKPYYYHQRRQASPLPPARTKRGGIENSLPRGDVL